MNVLYGKTVHPERLQVRVCGFMLLFLMLAGRGWTEAEDQVLVIDPQPGPSAVYRAVATGNAVSVELLFDGAKMRWLVYNARGDALGCVYLDERWRLRLLDLRTGSDVSPTWDMEPIPSELQGELSPDGQTVCFVQNRHTSDEAIGVLDMATGEIEAVTVGNGPGTLSPPSWSPNGRAIAYYYGYRNATSDDGYSVWTSARTQDEWVHTTVAPASLLGMRSPARRRAPVWSRNGKCVVLEARYREDERGHHVYAVDRDGGNLQSLEDLIGPCQAFAHSGGLVWGQAQDGLVGLDVETGTTVTLPLETAAAGPKFSPGGRFVVYWRDATVWLAETWNMSAPRKILSSDPMIHGDDYFWVGKAGLLGKSE
jgi:hypothetical protein